MEGEAGPVHVDYSCSIDTRYWFTYSPFNQSTNVYQTHFCWGNLTIGWHPDDDVPCSRLRDSGESEKSFKNKKTRGGWGETARRPATVPFAKSCASYFRFARLIRPHYTI